MNVKPDYPLRPDQTPQPILWRTPMPIVREVPEAADEVLLARYGPGRAMRLNTYGHLGDKYSAHIISVRSGTPLHIDPAYTRYTHQLIVHNDGWYLHGLDASMPQEPFAVGTFFCMDTHSPHKVSPDLRLGTGLWYVALVVDADKPLDTLEALTRLRPLVERPAPNLDYSIVPMHAR